MIPKNYGGIDRLYGDISVESADKILDLIDEYTDLVESVSESKDNDVVDEKKA